jgi:hypoxanthine phosphoribosyltransferase
MRPRIFIGSSVESVGVAEEIQAKLSSVANPVVWTDDVFRLSEYTCEALFRQLDRADYAIFVLSFDDIVSKRGAIGKSPRDNVVFELGLFAGRLGLRRTFIVHPDIPELKLPSDLLGVTLAKYKVQSDMTLSSSLGPACTRIKGIIGDQTDYRIVSWQEYSTLVNSAIKQVKRSAGRGGFSFDTCVGISRGGIIAADLIARHYGMNIPVVCLWADLHISYPKTVFRPPANWINEFVIQTLRNHKVKNILLVNDISRSGQSIELAKEFLVDNLSSKNVKTATLIVDENRYEHVDFYGAKYDTEGLRLPYYDLG